MNRLSDRLTHIAAMVSCGEVLADVGCDHGYLPIYLVRGQRIRRAIAMDINEGPLLRAREHIAQERLGDYIETRLSNGLEGLVPGEADAVVIAGLGGNLMIDILRRGRAVVRELGQLVLGPQSELAAVRAYVRGENYRIEAEDFVLEDGKYYPILRVLPREASDADVFARENGLPAELLDAYGHQLLAAHHPVLLSFLERERRQCEAILWELSRGNADDARIAARREAVRAQLERNRAAEAYMKEG